MASTKFSLCEEIVYSRRQIEGLIADGRAIIIVEQKVLKVDSWLKYHPGGDKAILHMVGRDATDELNALHSPEARQQMERYRIGRIEERWLNYVPPIQGGKFRPYVDSTEVLETDGEDCEQNIPSTDISRTPSPIFDVAESNLRQRKSITIDTPISSASSVTSIAEAEDNMSHLDILTKQQIDLDHAKYPPLDSATQDDVVRKYRLLNARLRAEGLYDCDYGAYAIEVIRYTFLACMTVMCLRSGWYSLAGVFLGCLWHQLVFTVHDAGHMGITHDFQTDTVIGIVIANFIGGLSVGWWKRNHNVHHIVTNSPEHDPDIQHMPFLAVSHRYLESLRSTFYEWIMPYDAFTKAVLPYQSYYYYFILLFGRFNLYVHSWKFLIVGQGPRKGPASWHRWLEIVGQIFFWYWFGYVIMFKTIPTASGRWAFLMVSHMVTMPLHAQITLSHFAMSTTELGPHESFPQKMLRTTMDIECPQWLDFFHGGLQFQAVHHLFPRMPRHNLRRAQKLVQEFCVDVGIPYALYGFVEGNKRVVGRLQDVARQAAILAKCQRVCAEEAFEGHI